MPISPAKKFLGVQTAAQAVMGLLETHGKMRIENKRLAMCEDDSIRGLFQAALVILEHFAWHLELLGHHA